MTEQTIDGTNMKNMKKLYKEQMIDKVLDVTNVTTNTRQNK